MPSTAYRLRLGAQIVVAVVGLVTQAVYTIAYGAHFQRFTAWNYTLVYTFVLLDVFEKLSGVCALALAPLTVGSSLTTAFAAAVIMGHRYGIVQQAYHDHAAAVVEVGNAQLHIVPAVTVVVLLVYRWGERYRAAWQRVTSPETALVAAATTAFCFAGSYFYVFSPEAEYDISDMSNHDARQYAVLALVSFSTVYTGGCLGVAGR